MYQAETQRFLRGDGTTNSDNDMTIEGFYPTGLKFQTKNIAFFAENQFKISERFSVTPGFRYEYISAIATGRFDINAGKEIALPEQTRNRNQPLFGLGLEYKFISNYLQQKISKDELILQLSTAINQFSKRQMTWFRKMEKEGVKINWIEKGTNIEELVKELKIHL